jgi:hypothetical protein
LLLEAHRREKVAGSKYSLLWTGRGQVAHSLYETLGYRDVYTPDLVACHMVNRGHKHGSFTLNQVKVGEEGLLDGLHLKATVQRLGFTPRPPGIVRSLVHLGFLDRESLNLVYRDGRLAGYAILQKRPFWCSLDELVLEMGTSLEEVLPAFETVAEGGWFAIRNTAVRDGRHLLESRGFHYSPFAYYSLLALPLERSTEDIAGELGTGSPRFTCQQLDYF